MIKISKICTKNDIALFKRFINEYIPFSDDSLWLGASIHDIPCGVLLADTRNKDTGTCNVDFLFIHPAVRHMGVATKLLDTLIEEAQKLKCKKVVVGSTQDMKTIDEISPFFKNYGFDPVEIEANIYTITPKYFHESGKIKEFANRKIIIPNNIKIYSSDQVDKNLLASLKEKRDVDYLKIYDPFPENDKFKLKHTNTFFAVYNSSEIVGWMVGLDAFGDSIYYKTLFVKEKYRHLALGLVLQNICLKNHMTKYLDRSVFLGISRKNDRALKFFSIYSKGINKDTSYEFSFTKNL